MRISTLAIGTLAVFTAQGLMHTDGAKPDAKPVPAGGDGQANRPLTPATAAQSGQSARSTPAHIARPELLGRGMLSVGASAIEGQLLPASGEAIAALDLPTVTIPARPTLKLPSLSVVPIDQIIAQSLAPMLAPAAQVPSPKTPARPPANAPAAPENSHPSKLPLSDLSGHSAQSVILALVDQGIVHGFPDRTFRPDAAITQAQFATLMQRTFPAQAMQWTDQSALPTGVTTRSQAAQFIHAAIAAADQPKSGTQARTQAETQATTIAAGVKAEAKLLKPSDRTLNAAGLTTAFPPVSAPETIPVARLASAGNAMASSAAVSNDADYVLGAGDRLRLDVFGVPEYGGEYPVLVNGSLNLPLVGSVSVKGMSLRQASDAIAAEYAPLLKRSIVTLNLLSARPVNVAIAGEVGRPGSYTLALEGNKFPTLTKVVQQAGGLTRTADLRQVEVRRPQRSGPPQQIKVDLWALLQGGNLDQDLVLRDGDSILIPATSDINLAEAPQLAAANFAADPDRPIAIAVVGEVARPGPYTLSAKDKDGKRGIPTVTQAIQQAGGINQIADLQQIQIRRATRSGAEQTVRVNLWQLLQTGDLRQDLTLQQGDTIVIPTATGMNPAQASQLAAASFSPDSMKVNVVGEVVTPGIVTVAPNTPLNQALLASGGFNKRARKRSVQLIRLNPNGTVTQREIAVNLGAGINDQTNPILLHNDILVVDRTGGAKFSDGLNTILDPLSRLLPFGFLLK